MRPTLLLILAFSLPVFAQDKPPAGNAPELDKDTQIRIRAEHSAGGLGKITDEEKAGAAAGAGPHLSRETGPARREPAEESPSKDEQQGVNSGNAPNDARRP